MEKVNEKKSVHPIRARINALESEILRLKKLLCDSRNLVCKLSDYLDELLSVFDCPAVRDSLSADQTRTVVRCALRSVVLLDDIEL